tara:strand:+ start:1261 stop:2559 length:1299 start_codon:yes stop_codon:yes gene_type:complete
MRQIIKEQTEFNISSLDEFIVSDEIINSGNYAEAQKIIQKCYTKRDALAEKFYRLGNRFFNADKIRAAELAWRKAANLSVVTEVAKQSEPVSLNLEKLRLQTVGSILIVVVIFYVIIFTLFERGSEPFEFSKLSTSAGEISFWDEWWDTGRPVKHALNRRFGAEELWPLLKQKFENLFERKKEVSVDEIQQKLKHLLELARSPNFRGGPTDYYALTARGLFEALEYDESIATLKEGLYYAESPEQVEQLYQDLGTVHYYKGYKLQPDGLARYVLKDVQNSIVSYENALRYGEDPYLYGNLGWGYYLLGNYVSSVENSLKALNMKPELNYARMNLGIAYIKQRAYKNAYDAYESLMKYNPERDEYEGGIRDLMELQQEFPGVYPFSNFVLAQLYRQQGRNKEANELLHKFLRTKFPDANWYHKARLLLRNIES